jgi:hypothetical protein
LIVLGDTTSTEIFSWLRVYGAQLSPLSQFGRVLLASEWEKFVANGSPQLNASRREDRWASVIVGEALAQGEGDVELQGMPLSRALGCFTTAVARAAIVHENDDATRTCIDRLRRLEADQRFVRRSVVIDDLVPVWALVDSGVDGAISAVDAATLVLDAAKNVWPKEMPGMASSRPLLRAHPGLISDSVEERVLAFHQLVVEMLRHANTEDYRNVSGVWLAAAAIFVGRSTSHAFLLRRIARAIPSAYVWFGLMAALAGPRTWDPVWSRAAKSVEKIVRARLDLTEVQGADLCWAEFAWLASTFSGGDVFSEIPKMLSRVLSIEVVPGATCQLRLIGGGGQESETRAPAEVGERDKELSDVLAQFISLASRARSLLNGKVVPVQETLGFGGSGANRKSVRSRRPRRNEGDSEA